MSTQELPAPVAYRLRVFRGDPDKYGQCEVCSKPSDAVYLLTKMIRYERPSGPDGLRYAGSGLFGHKKCLSLITEQD